ncbi:MAG: hypothetical protein KME06_20735 [Kastovskya adunca ATA6-11-RM4]|jgi:hypothetical protein|nr:hypothetical protein [Kastovskya adunca ATA6-11-RM4]
MRTYTSIFLLSILSISLSVDAKLINFRSTGRQTSTIVPQLLSKIIVPSNPQPSPHRGSDRREFRQSQATSVSNLICHRGSGRREFCVS